MVCQMNTADSERLIASVESVGYTPTEDRRNYRFNIIKYLCSNENAETKVYGA